ncbi:hypothetical protein SPRG_16462 [Saprolegnia parasitica CBS 223.65]|uniref:Uncharacterized protein n=1 Tax=Saprolegnia parasitica (strain CBS 223.65) TaxID=695850 RepID=A0A067BU43_SAPPC|nr:hypothetical protein SPRG_16462 [Saprolegnia parasitica CBS 223.65]KDO18137.1 hypothetical protein SPRG_16462 [Saprolegnia parasitica CBS 223.65]|eukprot:XP_012211152.1 hypothetical protein SPRG_16462 [Saprolegnia parasitica CBS 223.65]
MAGRNKKTKLKKAHNSLYKASKRHAGPLNGHGASALRLALSSDPSDLNGCSGNLHGGPGTLGDCPEALDSNCSD